MIDLLHHILLRAAERAPEKTAMRCNGESLTYGEWLSRSSALAAALRAQGVERGDRVGVLLNKSLETPVAVYAIWMAGAAFVPLDPLAPVARLGFAVQDSGARHLITHEAKRAAAATLAADHGVAHVFGLAPGADLPAHAMHWGDVLTSGAPGPDVALTQDDLAYVMYTSGSTGTPKGLMHTHRSGLAYARLSADLYDVQPDDVLSNHSPLHFDMSTFDYFTGPLRGATTVIIPEPVTKFPASLSKLMQDERLTIWYSVTTALVQLVLRGALAQRDLTALRWILYGGEPFPPAALRELQSLLPAARVSNVYGPAEVNQCTYYHVPAVGAETAVAADDAVPIGEIWAESEGLLLDADDNEAAPGEIGELVVRTPTMMRGYWNRPDLNARAFYHRSAPGRLDDVFYRTGDLMRLDRQGRLRFCGRKDRQIKTRGYRVELDEVETALSLHPAVAEVGAYATPDGEGSLWVEAAVIVRDSHTVSEAELKTDVARRLPVYAVPHTIVFLSDFPRTGTGKIDRRALAELAAQRSHAERASAQTASKAMA